MCIPVKGRARAFTRIREQAPKRNSPKRGSPAENPRPLPVLGPVRGSGAPEEGVMLHALLPEVFALISVLEVELDGVFVVALQGGNGAIVATRGMGDRYHFGSIRCRPCKMLTVHFQKRLRSRHIQSMQYEVEA